MQIQKNITLTGSNGKPITTDIFFPADGKRKPAVIYAHGFNGFKDWGNFDIIARQFAEAGFVFIKFNFSHNGTTPAQPEDFADLEAYGQNNYTKELYDLQVVIDWALNNQNPHANNIDANKLYLIGHSRGGGIVILKASEDKRVKAVATWASVSECKTPWGSWSEQKLQEWQQAGVQFYLNSRTRQQMPLYYQLYEDYMANKERLNITKAIKALSIQLLICHGTKDEAVPVTKAYELKNANPTAELFLVESDHVFGRRHPWPEAELPEPMQQVVDKTIRFFS
jgi:dipeptidyl aminopeptidase/acylaminoacyl peptidase